MAHVAKGTQAIDKQLGTLVSIGNSLGFMEKYINESSPAEFILRKLQNVHFSKPVAVAGIVKFYGKSSSTSDSIMAAVLRSIGCHNIPCVQIFKKVTVGCQTFSSKLCQQQERRDNSVAQYVHQSRISYGVLQCFCKAGEREFAVVNKIQVEGEQFEHLETGYTLSPLVPVQLTTDIEVIELPCEMQKYIFVHKFMCLPPNCFKVNL